MERRGLLITLAATVWILALIAGRSLDEGSTFGPGSSLRHRPADPAAANDATPAADNAASEPTAANDAPLAADNAGPEPSPVDPSATDQAGSGANPADPSATAPAPTRPAPADPSATDPAHEAMGEARPATVAPKRAGEARSTAVASTAERARVATVIGDGIASHPAPGSPETEHWFSNPTELGGPRAFLVVGEAAGSVEVLLPVRPNGRTGWLPASAVSVSEITVSAEVDLSERRLRVWDGSRLLVDTAVVVGKPSSPTPLGRFYVRDIIDRDDVGGPYGPHILALSGFSEALDSFMGAEPVIALHGTNKPHLVGHDRSNGCVRIPNEIVAELASLAPLGMPVTIVA